MTDSDAEMIASLKGFTPGPWERDGICVSQMSRPPTEICLMGNPPQYPGDTGGMMVNSMHNAALIAAAPDLHRIATEQAAEIARLRQALLLAKRLVDEALPKFEWGKSSLDANAITLLNETPAAINAALRAKP